MSQQWSPSGLNRLCWAIGSISGAMEEKDEKKFLVNVIRVLLSLVEQKYGKENKASVASNIMYVVGQYPRFLKAHWKFLKTVVVKLFEFMHETFPGVQGMAVDTFLKICQKCGKKFVEVQPPETVPFVEKMMSHVTQDISELEHLHMCTYFEAVGYMVAVAPPDAKERHVQALMHVLNEEWNGMLKSLSIDSLVDQKALRNFSLVLRVNERMVSAAGVACHAQVSNMYTDMLKLYKICSEYISHSTAQNGFQAVNYAHISLMRNVKRDALRLVRTFVEVVGNEKSVAEIGMNCQQFAQRFVPPLLEPVLVDYRSNLPQARDAEVLDLLSTLATKLSDSISLEVTKIFEMVFECTLDMIKLDFQSYPDHRAKFYGLLQAVNSHCFEALFHLPEERLKLYVDSLIWAVKHEQPQVANSGLQILDQFLERLLRGPPQIYVSFFKQYYHILLQDILSVLTDTLHTAGIKLQQHILLQLIQALRSALKEVFSKTAVMESLFELIGKSFPTLHKSQVEIFVLGLFNKCDEPNDFQPHIRDFLIQVREWSGHEDALYEEERQAALLDSQLKENGWRMQVNEQIGLSQGTFPGSQFTCLF